MVKTHAAPVKPGLALYTFLQEEWRALGTTRGAWCRQADLPDSTVHRWSQGHEPDMKSLRAVATALERPFTDILLAAGYVTPEELGGALLSPRKPPTLDEALKLDPELIADPGQQELLTQVVDSIRTGYRRLSTDGKSVRARKAVGTRKGRMES